MQGNRSAEVLLGLAGRFIPFKVDRPFPPLLPEQQQFPQSGVDPGPSGAPFQEQPILLDRSIDPLTCFVRMGQTVPQDNRIGPGLNGGEVGVCRSVEIPPHVTGVAQGAEEKERRVTRGPGSFENDGRLVEPVPGGQGFPHSVEHLR